MGIGSGKRLMSDSITGRKEGRKKDVTGSDSVDLWNNSMIPGAEFSDWRGREKYDLSALPKKYSERWRCVIGQESPDERDRRDRGEL